MEENVIEIVKENAATALRNIIVDLRNRLPNKLAISETTVRGELLHGQLISFKKLHFIPSDRNREDVKKARQEWLAVVMFG